ncbi:hypothetical protein BDN71DRAFT_1383390 [Pleurotus eryngii]|uniref:Uncharacterized protein n=1 Tax=Pleurotus eryngii TaxID=5323 RepID=A0A9P6A4F4_PLEER|nr:hypothetical protein BDN71DRAFT_1383390 [Pleurotus eryngii]
MYHWLFKVVMPIKINIFKGLLYAHPNRAFVESVLIRLRDSFWPWAKTDHTQLSIIDNSMRP